MKFDMNQAWRDASSMVLANRNVLAIIAGVFFFLPSFAMAVFAPMPEAAADMDEAQVMALFGTYYGEAAPWLLLTGLAQALGVLALLALLTDRQRPTVGDALKTGGGSLLPYIAAQILLGLVVGLGLMLVAGIVAASGSGALAAILFPVAFTGIVYAMVKTSLTAPVVVIEGLRNPARALARSWLLTKGNSMRLFGFYFLLLLAFGVVMILVSMVIGALIILVMGEGETSKIVLGAVSALIGSAGIVYFVTVMASTHRQLSSPSADAISETFQ